jgi:diguanylate cyclase (GGDEF)-like protein
LTPLVDGASEDAVGSDQPQYEAWLFQTMLDELSVSELGIGFIYSVLDELVKRYALNDAVVILRHESFGAQMFRAGGQAISVDLASRLGTAPGVYCDPDIVPNVERDAVRTACQLALSLHLARFSAAHDALTNIANRRTFDSALQASCVRSSRYGWAFTLVLADLNGFKAVNDSLGHAVGDDLLRQFGLAMRRSVRSGDVAARIGGDEFAVILSNADGHDSSGFTDRLRSHLGSVRELVGFTIGTASSPRDSTDPAELFRIADARLYEKKGFNHR